MRIACVCSSKGSLFRFYRTSRDSRPHLSELLTVLLEDRFNARIGGLDGDPDVVLTVGPLDAASASEVRGHVMNHLGIEPVCVTGPWNP
jgi:hypothetical protein